MHERDDMRGLPIGTVREWESGRHVKTSEGWMRVEQVGEKRGVGGWQDVSYEKVDLATFRDNVKKNLQSVLDHNKKMYRISVDTKVDADNVEGFAVTAKQTGQSFITAHSKALTDLTRVKIDKHLDNVLAAIKEAVKDKSLSGVSGKVLDAFIQEDLKRLVHQEVETKKRSLGDHGIRHVCTNAENSLNMLNQLQAAGVPVTGKHKLMALTIQANHDIGYTVGEAGKEAAKGKAHKEDSYVILNEERERFDAIFGKDDTDRILHIVRTHDEVVKKAPRKNESGQKTYEIVGSNLDWENDPVGSAVRLADATSLFGQEKLQDLFLRSPKAMSLVLKYKMAMDAGDKDLQENIVKSLHKQVDSEDFNEIDKELLHRQVDEATQPKGAAYATKDIISRYSGRLVGFRFDSDKGVMHVEAKYVAEVEILDQIFADSVSAGKFKSLCEDLGAEAIESKKGETQFSYEGKPVVRLSIGGLDDKPASAAVTEEMKNFLSFTIRSNLNQARRMLMAPPEVTSVRDVRNALRAFEGKKKYFTSTEWDHLMGIFQKYENNPSELINALKSFPLLESERQFLLGAVNKVIEDIFLGLAEFLKRYAL